MHEFRVFQQSLPPEFPAYIGDEITGALTVAGFDLSRDVFFYDDYDAQEVLFYQFQVGTAADLEPHTHARFLRSSTPPFQGFLKTANLDMNLDESLADFGKRVDAILADFWGGKPSSLVSAEPLDPSEA